MSTCDTCVCISPARSASCGRLLLATQVDHTATTLRSLALRRGWRLRVLAPGLLDLRTDDAEVFVREACEALTSVETDEVRCVVVPADLDDTELLTRAMSAPSLSTAGARATHTDLLPLFDDELARFHAVYQPIVELDGGRVVGHESLLRATSPDGTPVFPDQLFPAAEAAGWTHVLDRIGRTTALRQAGPWLGEDLLFINFVPTSIYRPQVCLRTTEQAARDAGLRLDQLVFEVTEGHLVRDVEHLKGVFDYYRERGCRVALDDLGAGYSSLNLLVQLRPDFVKLDKDIVQSLPDPVSTAVVRAIVDITHAYGGIVLAECVETPEQAQSARDLGVDLGQGWLFGRPVSTTPVPTAGAAASERIDPSRPDPAVALSRTPERAGQPASLADEPPSPEPLTPPVPLQLTGLLSRAVQASAHGVVVVDVLAGDMPMVYVNEAFERMTGYPEADLLGHNCRLLQGPGTDRAAVTGIAAAVASAREHRCVVQNYRQDGTPWWNELHLSPVHDADGRLTHYLGFQNDVTARVEAEQRLVHLAAHDALTGLPNRATMFVELDEALRRNTRADRAAAVLFLDLDGFKAVNDRHGHAVGDRVLVEVAERLRAALRTSDLLARHGGDEFVAVLGDLDPLDAERVAHRVATDAVAALERPVLVSGVSARVAASVGVAVFPDAGRTTDELLRAADGAMYEAKAAGSGSVRSSLPAAVPERCAEPQSG